MYCRMEELVKIIKGLRGKPLKVDWTEFEALKGKDNA